MPGYEWSGTVAEAGPGVADLERGGARVVCQGMVPCNRCRRCKAGHTNFCENYDQVGFSRGGEYGEFVVVPRRPRHPLRRGVPVDGRAREGTVAKVLLEHAPGG